MPNSIDNVSQINAAQNFVKQGLELAQSGKLNGIFAGEDIDASVLNFARDLASFAGVKGLHNFDNLMCLGDFVFRLQTAPFQTKDETKNYRHAESGRVGLPSLSQFVGVDNAELKLDCQFCPELTGGEKTIKILEDMAATGEAYPLIDGVFNYQGHYKILKISKKSSHFLSNGLAQAIDLSIDLKQVAAWDEWDELSEGDFAAENNEDENNVPTE